MDINTASRKRNAKRTIYKVPVLFAFICSILTATGCTPANEKAATDAACDSIGVVITAIVTALVALPAAPASVVSGVAGVGFSEACKRLFASDTTPQDATTFLTENKSVPEEFRLPNGNTAVCDASAGQYGIAATGVATERAWPDGTSSYTSCPFAEAVRDEFKRSGARVGSMINVFSPKTGLRYDMRCSAISGYDPGVVVQCAGGNRALVFLYGTPG